jgi:hypothetical protein
VIFVVSLVAGAGNAIFAQLLSRYRSTRRPLSSRANAVFYDFKLRVFDRRAFRRLVDPTNILFPPAAKPVDRVNNPVYMA